MSDPNTLGGLVRRRRLESGYSLGQLASKVGKTAAEVRSWERDNELPEHGILERLAETLELDLGEIQKKVAEARSSAGKGAAAKGTKSAQAKRSAAAKGKKAGVATTGQKVAEKGEDAEVGEADTPDVEQKPAAKGKKPGAEAKKTAPKKAAATAAAATTAELGDAEADESAAAESAKPEAKAEKPGSTKSKKPAARGKPAQTSAAAAAVGEDEPIDEKGDEAQKIASSTKPATAAKKRPKRAGTGAKKAAAAAGAAAAGAAVAGAAAESGAGAASAATAKNAAAVTGKAAAANEMPPKKAKAVREPQSVDVPEETDVVTRAAEDADAAIDEALPGFVVDDPFTPPPPVEESDADLLDAPTEAVPVPVITDTAAAARAKRAAVLLEEPAPQLPMVEPAPDADPGLLRYLEPLRVLYDPHNRYLYWLRAGLTVIVMVILAVVFLRLLGSLLDAISQLLDTIEPSTPSPDDLDALGIFPPRAS